MRRLVFLAALLLPLAAFAQEVDMGVRASANVDVRLVKGLHLTAGEELRTSSEGLDNLRTSVGLSYKLNPFVRFGTGYTLINPYKNSEGYFNYPRHRFHFDVTGTYRAGDLLFSLRERVLLTHRTGIFNEYQSTRNSVALRTRMGAKYKGMESVEPFVFLDIKTILNDPWGSTTGSLSKTESGKEYYYYTHEGYTHAYVSRYRINAGADIKLAKQHTLCPYVLLDFCSNYQIDTSSDGTRLFTDTTRWVDTFCLSLGISYTYSF